MASSTADRGGEPGAPRGARSGAAGEADQAARRRFNFSVWNLLLLIPFVGVLIPAFYNKADPDWGGMPFFYWYQLLWIPISVVLTVVVYKMTKGER